SRVEGRPSESARRCPGHDSRPAEVRGNPESRVSRACSQAITLALAFSGMEAWIASSEASRATRIPAGERFLAHLPRRHTACGRKRPANLPFRRGSENLAAQRGDLDRNGAKGGFHLLESPLERKAIHGVVTNTEGGRFADDGLDHAIAKRGGREGGQKVAGPALLHHDRRGPGIERARLQARLDRMRHHLGRGIVDLRLHEVKRLTAALAKAEA